MDRVDLDEEIRNRKENILRLKKEIETLKQARAVITGEVVEENPEKIEDDDM